MDVSPLFEPLTIKSMTLQNRFAMVAMSRYHCPGGIPTKDFAAFHRRRARGQIGLSITGATAIDRPAANNHPTLANFRPDSYDAWQHVVDEVHAENGPLVLQIWHAGALFNVDPDWKPEPIESPSGLMAPGQPIGVAMTDEMIADTIEAYAKAAAKAKEIGFDSVQIHGAHGFLREVVRAVRAAVGPDMPVSLRVSQWKEQDYDVKLAKTPEELRQWLEPLVAEGVDYLDCSQRRFWEPEFEGSDLNFAGWVKKVTGVPVITCGSVGLNTDVMTFFHGADAQPAPLDELIRRFDRGDFDIVGVGRAFLADADWIIKVRDGRFGELSEIQPKRVLATDAELAV
jgi:2,4-dienoyl-CoA reductase-like NADH-dependent reductase (Old Yellow Enzyme family)